MSEVDLLRYLDQKTKRRALSGPLRRSQGYVSLMSATLCDDPGEIIGPPGVMDWAAKIWLGDHQLIKFF